MGRISFPQGKGSQMHNRREYEKYGKEVPKNIDQTRTHMNVTLVDRDIREAYRDFFGEALSEFNGKQKRADRKIDDYYDHILKSKNGEKPFYEDVLQWGTKDDFVAHPEKWDILCEALEEYVRGFEQRNPNLKLIGAYIHMDEASPHLHLDYVPVAHGYKRGLNTRNSLDRAMKEMGYIPEKESKRNNATKLWKDHERAYFGEMCREYGLEVEEERKGRGHSFTVEEYGAEKDRMRAEIVGNLTEELESTKDEIAANNETISKQEIEIQAKSNQIKTIDTVVEQIGKDTSLKAEDLLIPEKKGLFGKVEVPEQQGVFVQNMSRSELETLIKHAKTSDALEDSIERTQAYCRNLISDAEKEAESIKNEATAEKNSTIAEAEKIVRHKESIIEKAKSWALSVQNKYNDLVDKFNELLGRKSKLEKEVADIEAYRDKLEPLRVEYNDLRDGIEIMSGQLDNQITQAKFRDINTFGFHEDYWGYRDRGELLALYKDGTTRIVGSNEKGGFDNKTLADTSKGLCRVGVMQTEERVRVPKSLVQELIANRDRSKPITNNLSNFIDQQTKVHEVTRNRGRSR